MFVASAPYRVSLLGGGSDYPEHFNEHGGATFGFAISDRLYISSTRINPDFSGHNFKFTYREIDAVKHLDDVKHLPFREVTKLYSLEPGWEINVSSNLPGYTGLGSSSSFSAALVTILEKIKGQESSKSELVTKIFNIERSTFHQKIGLQDQVFAVNGGCHLIDFKAINTYGLTTLDKLKTTRLTENVVLISTETKRSAGDYAKEVSESAKAQENNMAALARLAIEGFGLANSPELDLPSFGKLVNESWKLKKFLSSKTSNSHVDFIIERCNSSGALGAKLLGAGGGGFVAAIVEPDRFQNFMIKTQFPLQMFHHVQPDWFGVKISEV